MSNTSGASISKKENKSTLQGRGVTLEGRGEGAPWGMGGGYKKGVGIMPLLGGALAGK